MRVSNRFLYSQLVKDINANTEKLFRLNSQISSGKRIDRPSEDPLGMAEVLVNRTELSGFNQFKKSIDLANGWLARTDSIANDLDNLLARASELAVQASSATETAETRAGAAEEIKEIRAMVLSHANSKYGNKYLFGGTMTQNPPFLEADASMLQADVATMAADDAGALTNLGGTASAGDRYINTTNGNIYEYDGAAWNLSASGAEGISTVVLDRSSELYVYQGGQWQTQYQGNSETFAIKIGKNDTAEINVPGDEMFRNNAGDIFMTLMNLENALRSNDVEGIRDQLPEIENSSKVLSNKLARVGAVVNRLEHTETVIDIAIVDNKQTTSDIEDLDYADAITSLQNQQTIYEATLKSASMITSMSLVDFMS